MISRANRRSVTRLTVTVLASLVAAGSVHAAEATPPTAQEAAPLDLTGYWVSIVTEDWRFRMVVADADDTDSIPLNPAGVAAAKAWNAAKDKADPEAACKAYGAPGLMRIPGRVHITWQDPSTLKVQTDSGTQERLFHFGGTVPANNPPSWQGYSTASWDGLKPPVRNAPPPRVKEGFLKVVTTGLRPGYLRTNGAPYSARTQLLEYYDTVTEPTGAVYLVVTNVVQDPENLTEPFVTSAHFLKIPDDKGWDPTPCRAGVPR
ncbi:MAG: hypothetical protein ABL964_08605 [Steroidobacteraceae bacterium]